MEALLLLFVAGFMALYVVLFARIQVLENEVERLNNTKLEFVENIYLKILEVEAINSTVNESDLVVLEQLKKKLLEDMEL